MTSAPPNAPSKRNAPTVAPLTPYHARYYAMLMSRGGMDGAGAGSGVERYLPALFSAGIDLHPHQIDAAVFASRSPFREGVILADEEGLGKTIEAGLVLLLASLEGRRRLLVLCPPALVARDVPGRLGHEVPARDGIRGQEIDFFRKPRLRRGHRPPGRTGRGEGRRQGASPS